MQITTKEATRLMRKLELEFVECKHHMRNFLVVDGKRILAVHCSFGSKDMPGNISQRFRKSLELDKDEFTILRSCTMDRLQYLKILRAKGIL
jgi:hypothetical protein